MIRHEQRRHTIGPPPIVEEEIHLTLQELCQACRASEEYVTTWVFEGVLEPIGEAPRTGASRGNPCGARGWPCG